MLKKTLFVLTLIVLFSSVSALGLLQDIKVSPTGDNKTEIILEMDKVINFTDFSITAPDIIVFDLIAVDNGLTGSYYEMDAVTGIKSIEIMKDNESNFLRIMIELSDRYAYNKSYQGNNIVISLDNSLAGSFDSWLASDHSASSKENDQNISTFKTDYNITMDVENADVVTLLRGIADYIGINLVMSNNVSGNVTIHVKDVPWKDLFDLITRMAGLTYEEFPNMIRVGTYKEFATEQTAMQESLPLLTKVYKLEYATPRDMQASLKPVLSKRGVITIDERTNSMVVKDINDVHKKIQNIIAEIDKKNLQVEIVVKVVEINDDITRSLGIDWTINNIGLSQANVIGGIGVNTPVSVTSGEVSIGTIRNFAQIDAVLQTMEISGKSKTLSNPRITATNNTEANILGGQQFFVQSVDANGNIVNTQYTVGTILNVTPHVNSMKDITLDIEAELSTVQDPTSLRPTINTTNAKTVQMVQDGETVVMGGFVLDQETRTQTGFPLLRSIPIIGHLFKSDETIVRSKEVLIFISPHIVRTIE